MPDDLAEFRALQRRQGPECRVAVALRDLDSADARKLRKALDTPDLPGTAIAAWLSAHDHKVVDGAVQRHRSGRCSCVRS